MAMTQTYKAGEIIFEEGKYQLWMYELLSGCVEVYKNYGKEDEQKISEITEGYFGEMGLIDALPRSATIIAKEETTVAILDEDTFVEYLKDADKITKLFISLAEHLNNINENYKEACQTAKEYLAAEEANHPISTAVSSAMSKFAKIFNAR